MSSKRTNTENLQNSAKRLLTTENSENQQNDEKTIKTTPTHYCLDLLRCVDILKTGVRVKDDCEVCIKNSFEAREQKLKNLQEFLQEFEKQFKMADDEARTRTLLTAIFEEQSKDFVTFGDANEEKLKNIAALIDELFGKILVHKQEYDETNSVLIYGEELIEQLKNETNQNDEKNKKIHKKYEETDEKLAQKTESQEEFLMQLEKKEAQMDKDLANLASTHQRYFSLLKDLSIRKEYLEKEMNQEIETQESLQESIDKLRAHFEMYSDESHKFRTEEDDIELQLENADVEIEKLEKKLATKETKIVGFEEKITKYRVEKDVTTNGIKQNEEEKKNLQHKIDSLEKEVENKNKFLLIQSNVCKDFEKQIKNLLSKKEGKKESCEKSSESSSTTTEEEEPVQTKPKRARRSQRNRK